MRTEKKFKLADRGIEGLLLLAENASEQVMKVYESSSHGARRKKDNSPVTRADTLSNNILTSGVKKLYPEIPVLSEESGEIPYEKRKSWEYFWLIDPLDGTREFLSRNGEFTINIALIEKQSPIFGLVSVPSRKAVYYACRGRGAYVKDQGGRIRRINAARLPKGATIVVARSRSHSNEAEDEIVKRLGPAKTLHAGSALKFCLVAEGKADVYLRCSPTMEWDTAAGQCVAEEAGAGVSAMDGAPFLYNKESLLNPGFVCAVDCFRGRLRMIIDDNMT